jgi:arylsulfatase A-like enzyme
MNRALHSTALFQARSLVVLAASLVLWACTESASPRPRNVLLLTLDTTNAGALSCYGEHPGITPNLDELAREGILFENAYSTAPFTMPAHSSIMTGLYPLRHGARMNGTLRLSPDARTLAEVAQEHGLQTAGFVTCVILSRNFGIDQGFDEFGEPKDKRKTGLSAGRRSGRDMTDEALAWLAGRDRSQPFFVWMHYYDPHAPYKPRPPFYEQAGRDPYLSDVAMMDHEIGRVFEALKASGDWAQTLVVAVADHGEGLGRHGESTHGVFAWNSTLRVPLLWRDPLDPERAGTREARFVSSLDVFPTLLESMGWGSPGDVDGTSLLRPSAERERGAYFESCLAYLSFNWSPLVGWYDGRHKLIHSSQPLFFDLEQDEGETRNLYSERPEEVARLRDEIERIAARPRLAATEGVQVSSELAAQLAGLGYAEGVGVASEIPEPLAESELASPNDMVDVWDKFNEAHMAVVEKENEKALEAIVPVLERDPGNANGWYVKGMALIQMGRHAEAAEAFEQSVKLRKGRRHMGLYLHLAVCEQILGRGDAALEHYRFALGQEVGPPGALERFVKFLLEKGLAEEAQVHMNRLPADRRQLLQRQLRQQDG